MIKIQASDQAGIAAFKKEPGNRKNQYFLNSLFWDNVYKLIKERSDQGRSKDLNLGKFRTFMDLGILDAGLLENGEEDFKSIVAEAETPVADKNIFTFSQWIEQEYQRALNFDKRDLCRSEITLLDKEIEKKTAELKDKQGERRALFNASITTALSARGYRDSSQTDKYMGRYDAVARGDDLYYELQSAQKEIFSGKFMNVDLKRTLVAKNNEHQRNLEQMKSLVSEIRDPAAAKELIDMNEQVCAQINEIIELENRKVKKQAELDKIMNEAAAFSPVEIEARVNEVLDYFKGLMILSSKRVKIEPCSVATGKHRPATKTLLKKVLEQIVEFDPKVFKNDRVKYLGLPTFVLIPGLGKGLYDWKNNAVLVPTLAYGKFEEAVFAGVVEYKLDMDEDKILLTSYGGLEENKGMKSILRLKERFIKDYTTFMGQETRGYKVMAKDTRAWFTREIAPNRYEVKVPLEYDPIAMSQDEFEKLKASLLRKTQEKDADYRDHFGMGVIHAYFEEFDKAIERLKRSVELKPDFLDGIYNLGIVYMKKHLRREAGDCFADYIKKSPQNWWTSVCQEHLMRLR